MLRIVVFFAFALSGLFIAGCQTDTAPTPAPSPSAGDPLSSYAAPADHITALGTLLPTRQVSLGFTTSGPVLAVAVRIGTEVKAGDLIATLDTTELETNIQEAEDRLILARALLAQAQAGPREQQIAVAEAEYQRVLALYEQAQALYEQTLAQTHPEQVAIAQAEYDAALARYEQVKAGAGEEELAAAQARLQRVEIARQHAQAAYDQIAGQPDVGARPESAALQEATLDYQMAQAEYERLKDLPTKATLQAAKAQVDQAKARLRLAQIEPSRAEIVVATSNLAVAQAQVALAAADPRAEDIAVVEAQVQQAHTTLEHAKLALSQAQLHAPFDGTVSAVNLHPSEWAAAGAPVVELLDTTGWLVETRNIGELNIGRVRVGQEAIVRVMAFRDEELWGKIVAISPVAVVQQGDTTYTVMIELEPTDLNLRPGMNAEVEIVAE